MRAYDTLFMDSLTFYIKFIIHNCQNGTQTEAQPMFYAFFRQIMLYYYYREGAICHMDLSQMEVIRSYLDSLQVKLITANYAHRVHRQWGRPLRKDDYFRFYYIVDGEGWVRVNDEEFYPVPGQLMLLPADTLLTYSNISPNRFLKHWFHFSAKINNLHLSQLIHFPYCISVQDTEYISGLFKKLMDAYLSRTDLTAPLKTRIYLMEILTYYLEHAPAGSVGLLSSSPSPSNQILQYIEDHIAEPLTLEKLAGVFHYNPNYFIRYFRTMFKMSPIQYIGKVRIENAKRLLIDTDRSIEQIAKDIGLDRFYFSKIFRQSTSLSPSKYRVLHRSESSMEKADGS